METDQNHSRRPEDSPFKQQRLAAWQPILTPLRVIGIFVVIGIIFVPIGGVLLDKSNSIVEMTKQYDGAGADLKDCKINSANEEKTCTITFDVKEEMKSPVWVYYELTNFYQNHRRYVKSRSASQLLGERLSSGELTDCEPLKKDGGQLLNPCGLIANSMFNDKFVLESTDLDMDETGIAWKSDRDNKFAQVEGFKKKQAAPGQTCQDVFGSEKYDDCEEIDQDGKHYYYWYPANSRTKYLYETYPGIVSPLDGVEDEHFIVWMRTAGLPEFRKPYGRIKKDIRKGTQLTFNVTANFDVSEFDGTKSLVITEIGEYGGKNPFLGIAYIVVGCVSWFLAILFGVKHYVAPRPLGDVRYLGWGQN